MAKLCTRNRSERESAREVAGIARTARLRVAIAGRREPSYGCRVPGSWFTYSNRNRIRFGVRAIPILTNATVERHRFPPALVECTDAQTPDLSLAADRNRKLFRRIVVRRATGLAWR